MPILVILEDPVVTFLHFIEDHWLNDLLHSTQVSSKWWLAHFYKTGHMGSRGIVQLILNLGTRRLEVTFTQPSLYPAERTAITIE